MKLGKSIHEVFLFYTPKLIDIYFEFLKHKVRKSVGISTLLVMGNDLPNLFSESYMIDSSISTIFPKIREDADDDKQVTKNHETVTSVLNLEMGQKLKNFSKNQKKGQSHRSCIIDKKAS